MKTCVLIWLAKILSRVSRGFGWGVGGTWPGHIALKLYPGILRELEDKLAHGSVLITGTNGKTTAAKMLTAILRASSFRVVHNPTGANLLNGIASALIADGDFLGRPRSQIGVFEIDEASFPQAFALYNPEAVVVLNLFRDQLDRFGEIDLTAQKMHQALKKLPESAVAILNAKNAYAASLGKDLAAKVLYFGKDQTDVLADAFSVRFSYKGVIFKIPLGGLFTVLNAMAAITTAESLGVSLSTARDALSGFRPAFGRQEEFEISGKKVKIMLAKNPASFNANVRLLSSLPGLAAVLLVLNDNVPDGRDVSWIWDAKPARLIEMSREVIVSGLRADDMALRLKYCGREVKSLRLKVQSDLKKAVKLGLEFTPKGETFYILPTYSAMLEVRKILKGRKIL